jgi:hypothetical protein
MAQDGAVPARIKSVLRLTLDDLVEFNAALHFSQECSLNLKPAEIVDIYSDWFRTCEKQVEIIKTKLNPALQSIVDIKKHMRKAKLSKQN